MNNKNVRKEIIIIMIVTSIIFLLLSAYQILKCYKEVSEERKEYDLKYQNNIVDDSKYKESVMYNTEMPETATGAYLYYNIFRILMENLQICLLFSLILFFILVIRYKVKKETIGKENIAIMGLIVFLFLILSYGLFIFDWGIW